MQQIYAQEENILTKINALLSMYRCLSLTQISRMFPELSKEQLMTLLNKLERKGRLTMNLKDKLAFYTGVTQKDPAVLVSFWVLLDFGDSVIYHTICDYPVTLCFTANDNCYDVIFIPEGKEQLMNQAMSAYKDEDSKRILIVEDTAQITLLSVPDTVCYCTVSETGEVIYYQIQGELT